MPLLRYAPAALLLVSLTTSALAAGRELAPRELGPSPYRQSAPAIASNGGRFLTVWREERGFGTLIAGSLSDAAGKRISPASFVVSPNANPTWMELLATGDGYTLFWSRSFDDLQMVELDRDGRVLAERRLNVPQHIYRDVAWNGTHFVFAFRPPSNINGPAEAVIFTRSGEIVRGDIPLDDNVFFIEALATGGDFLILTSGYNGLYGHRIAADGTVTNTLLEPRRFGFQPIHPIAFDRGDGSLLIVWSAGDQSRSELATAVLSPTNEITRPVLIGARDATRRQLHPLLLMPAGDRYVLAFAEFAMTGQAEWFLSTMMLDAAGNIVQQPAEPISIGPFQPKAASNGTIMALALVEFDFIRTRLVQRVVDATGRLGDPELHSISLSRQRQPILGAGGGRFVAAFEEQSDKSRVRLASLDAFGEPQANRVIGTQAELPAELSWNGTEYLFVYFDSGNLRGLRLDADGRAIDATPMLIGGASAFAGLHVSVAWVGDKWLVVWTNPDRASFTTVSAAGVATQHGELTLKAPLPPNSWHSFGSIAVAGDKNRFVVAWVEIQYEICLFPLCGAQETKVWLMRFQYTGYPSTRAIPIVDEGHRVSMASTGDEYLLLADTPAETKALVIDDDYAMSFLASRTLPGGLSDAIWDGTEFVIAQRHRAVWPGQLVVTRLDRELNETAPPRGIETLRSDEPAAPSIASVIHGDALVAISEGDIVNGSRAVVYAERDMQELPGWPPPRRRAVR